MQTELLTAFSRFTSFFFPDRGPKGVGASRLTKIAQGVTLATPLL
jgi:hypothetical protein